MAREPKVTRTIKVTNVTFLAIDLVSAEPYTETVNITHAPKTEKLIMKKLEKEFDNENRKAVKIVDISITEKLYGMSEEDFIAYAEEMPPRKSNK